MTPECKIRFPELGEYRAVYRPTKNDDKRWTNIEDQTPPKREGVIFCCLIDCDADDSYFTDVQVGVWEGAHTDGNAIVMQIGSGPLGDWYPCTHWMPLPAAPRLPE